MWLAPSSLPRPKTSLIGRAGDIERGLGFALAEDSLVTLVGPGGVGKTRLAVEMACRPRTRCDVLICSLRMHSSCAQH